MIRLAVRPPAAFLWRPDTRQWTLRPSSGGQAAAPVRATPFSIGRALDCSLVLPESTEFAKTTSRRHCRIYEEGGRLMIADGSEAKPSTAGTWVNGVRLSAPAALALGDVIGLGPWTFAVEAFVDKPVDIDAGLENLGAAGPRTIPAGDPRVRDAFARLHELTMKLNRSADVEENLASVLDAATAALGRAEVAAILVEDSDGICSTRLAWRRGAGRVFDLRFSAALVRRLPQDRGFLFEGRLEDRTKSQLAENINSAILVPLWGNDERLGILYMDNRAGSGTFNEDDLCMAEALANCASLQLLREREAVRARVEESMSRYFSPNVVKLIAEEARQGRPMIPEVKEQTATILFVDMRGFSRFCRDRTPREVSELLNPYLQLAAECIQRHSGHVDKFIGDGVLGVFGALPLGRPGAHAREAARAAQELIALWAARPAPEGQKLALRAGINTGRVVIGSIGFPGRMEYSVLGDAVNLASRMEHLALPDGIAVTDATRELLGAEFPCVDAGEETVKGFGPIRVWRLGAGGAA